MVLYIYKNLYGGLSESMEQKRTYEEQEALIRKLELEAWSDPLTMLKNRRGFDLEMEKLDTPENLPITIILGDMNRLKYVNDTFGHHVGDTYLKAIASSLNCCLPDDSIIARIGGDEYLALIPHCDRAQAFGFITKINDNLAEMKFDPELSISLGFAIKAKPEEPIGLVVSSADKEMYAEKRLIKLEELRLKLLSTQE